MAVIQPLVCRSRGGRAGVIDALDAALTAGQQPVLAVVLETVGSTYASVADLALFGANQNHTDIDQIGWLSGGCIERDLALHAQQADTYRQVQWIEIDSRDDRDIFSGSATGCRGRLRLALLPISAMPDWRPLCQAWLHGSDAMEIKIDLRQRYVQVSVGSNRCRWNMAMDVPPWMPGEHQTDGWTTRIAPTPAVRIYGAGPETPWLLPLLRATGWHTCVVESRRDWLPYAALADQCIESTPNSLRDNNRVPVAALVMHHQFELDREALITLSTESEIGFIGLLGPARRRDDLFRTLPGHTTDALRNRLHAPVGTTQSTRGAEAIALSIAIQLQGLATRLRDTAAPVCPPSATTTAT